MSKMKSGRVSYSVFRLLAIALAAVPISACMGAWAKKLADREVYPIIEKKQAEALGESRAFTLEHTEDDQTRNIHENAGKAEDGFSTAGLRVTLAEALTLAVHNGRTYQTAKENLYLAALTLTAERHAFSPIFTGMVTGEYNRAPVIDTTLNEVTDATRTGSLDADLSLSKTLAATGARITVGLANSFTRFYSAPPAQNATGLATISVVQPILRGAGMRIAAEDLRQAERDVIYEVRDFSRFEKDFIVDRVEEYYRLLQSLNTVSNERRSYESIRDSLGRSIALGEAGRLGVFQVDQARQQELNAHNRWISAQIGFAQQLDRFKINLGLPTELAVFPDETELTKLMEQGIVSSHPGSTEAIQGALERRLDLMTLRNRAEDAERQIIIANNGLLPDLDLTFDATIPDEGIREPLQLDRQRRNTTFGAELELPLDRKSERNAYRSALIQWERAKREVALSRDSIIQEIRSNLQELDEAQLSYDLQSQSIEVAERRVESTQMLLQAGRSTVRDVLDSEISLRDARNALTRVVIDHMIARLRFLVAIEGLEIDDQGMWGETSPPEEIAQNGSGA